MNTATVHRLFAAALALALAATASAFDAADFWREPVNLPFDIAVLDHGEAEGVAWQTFVYTSEMYRNEPMRTLAHYAWPTAIGKHPGVVSIHGGGGHADLFRAKTFAKAGFACLSYEWNAFNPPADEWKPGEPLSVKPRTVYGSLRYTEWGGQFVDLGDDGKRPVLYRSVMAARRALTWLDERPEVDPGRLVVEGHSWGGFTTQLVAGIDPRIKAAVSAAAAGAWLSRYIAGIEGHTKVLEPWQMFEWSRRYDPAAYADNCTAPLLISLGVTDFFGSVDTLAEYLPRYRVRTGLQLLPGSIHGFGADVERRVAWFNYILHGGPPFPEITKVDVTVAKDGATATVRVEGSGPVPIHHGVVVWTTSAGPWSERVWRQRPLTADAGGWSASFPLSGGGGPLRAFVSLRDDNGALVSSLPVVRERGPLLGSGLSPAVVLSAAVPIAHAQAVPTAAAVDWAGIAAIGPIANRSELVGEEAATLSAQWDEQALYLRVQMADATPWQPRPQNRGWFDADSLQLRLRGDEHALDAAIPAGEQQVLHLGFFPDTNGGVGVEAARGRDRQTLMTDVAAITAAVSVEAGKGYALFVRVPWSVIAPRVAAKVGRKLRFALQINLGDELTGEKLAEIQFDHAGEAGRPEAWGEATLLER